MAAHSIPPQIVVAALRWMWLLEATLDTRLRASSSTKALLSTTVVLSLRILSLQALTVSTWKTFLLRFALLIFNLYFKGSTNGKQPASSSSIPSTSTGNTLAVKFDNEGTFPFYCDIHASSGMVGVVYVGSSCSSSTTPKSSDAGKCIWIVKSRLGAQSFASIHRFRKMQEKCKN